MGSSFGPQRQRQGDNQPFAYFWRAAKLFRTNRRPYCTKGLLRSVRLLGRHAIVRLLKLVQLSQFVPCFGFVVAGGPNVYRKTRPENLKAPEERKFCFFKTQTFRSSGASEFSGTFL